MSGYVKLFSDIIDSSIWDEDLATCKVWITMLALADWDGFVRGSIGFLAGKAKLSEGQVESAIEKFTSPDKRSRTKANEGRRVEVLEDGWLILNYLQFRDRLSHNPKSSASRDRVRKHRECYRALRNAKSVTSLASVSVPVVERVSESVRERGTVTFTKPSIEEIKLQCAKIGLPDAEADSFLNYYESNGWRVGKNPMRSWPHALANWKLNSTRYSYGKTNQRNHTENKRNVGTCPTTTNYASAAAKRTVAREVVGPTEPELPIG